MNDQSIDPKELKRRKAEKKARDRATMKRLGRMGFVESNGLAIIPEANYISLDLADPDVYTAETDAILSLVYNKGFQDGRRRTMKTIQDALGIRP